MYVVFRLFFSQNPDQVPCCVPSLICVCMCVLGGTPPVKVLASLSILFLAKNYLLLLPLSVFFVSMYDQTESQ